MSSPVYKQLYPHLFSPLTVGGATFKNRIFVAPTHTPFSAGVNNLMTPEGMRYYGGFAKGGAGAVHIGESLLDRVNSAAHDSHLNIIDEECLKTYNTYNEYCHIFGAKTSIEFNHSGHFAMPAFGDGRDPMSAMDMDMPSGVHVRAMNEDDMDYVAHIYCKAANMAKRAGFDMVLLHYGHGWLMGGFLSPILNKRTDKYGGSVENRMRFPLMVLERVRKTVGKDFLIEVRLSGDECVPEGIQIEDTIENVRMLQDYASIVHISTGNRFVPFSRAIMHPTHFIEEGHNVHLAARVKNTPDIHIPIGTLGGIDTPEFAEKVLAEGKADYVLMARGWIADPDWANKARCGKAEDIRPCIRCMHCLDIPLGKRNTSLHNIADIFDEFPTTTRRAECAVNVYHGNGQCRLDLPPAKSKKKVVVIGGGVAGLNAALTACERGHEVVLFEKSDTLGGQLSIYAPAMWFKIDNMERYRRYLEIQVRKAAIRLHLGEEATPERVAAESPDAVIVAVGAQPLLPPIPGLNAPHVFTAMNILGHEKEKLPGIRTAVIGGGMVGCEVALQLSHLGYTVDIVEMAPMLAPDGIYTERVHTLHLMDNDPNITSHVSTRCVEIEKDKIVVETSEGVETIRADAVIICTGMKSLDEEARQFDDLAFDVIHVGDCKKVGTVADATAAGYDAAAVL